MNAEQLKAHYDIVATIGETVKLKKQGREYMGLCPFHNDKNPSLSVSQDKQIFNCLGCGATGDVIEFVRRRDSHATAGDAIKAMTAKIGGGASVLARLAKNASRAVESTPTVPPPDVSADVEKWRTAYAGSAGAAYMELRGISQATAARFALGWNDKERRVVIPYDGGYTARAIDDTAAPKYRKATGWAGLHVFPDNADELLTATHGAPFGLRPVFVVEGEIDALSIIETGVAEAIAVGGTANFPKLAQRLRALRERAGHDLEPLVLIPDNDNAGRAAMGTLAAELKRAGIGYVLYGNDGTDNTIFNILDGKQKDVNDALNADRAGLTERITAAHRAAESEINRKARAAIQEYKKAAAGSAQSEADFDKYLEERAKPKKISTSFPSLDGILGGGLSAQLYAVGAISSWGKTSFCLQMAEEISAQGHDVIFFSLEMSRHELRAKGISRRTYLEAHSADGRGHYSNVVFTTGEVLNSRAVVIAPDFDTMRKETLEKARSRYNADAGNLYIREHAGNVTDADTGDGMTAKDIWEIVETHHAVTDRAPVVIIDYLQLLKPTDPKLAGDRRQSIDESVHLLKRLSRVMKTPVIVISSIGRAAYNRSIDLESWKESGGIEYSADVLIGLQAAGLFARKAANNEYVEQKEAKTAINESDTKDTRRIELVVPKNRNGITSGFNMDGDKLTDIYGVVNFRFNKPFSHFEDRGIQAVDPN